MVWSYKYVCHMYFSLLCTGLDLLIVSSAYIEKGIFSNLNFMKWMKISNFQVSGMQVALFYFKRKYTKMNVFRAFFEIIVIRMKIIRNNLRPFKEFWIDKSAKVNCGTNFDNLALSQEKKFVTDSPHDKCIIKIKRNFIPWHLEMDLFCSYCVLSQLFCIFYSTIPSVA